MLMAPSMEQCEAALFLLAKKSRGLPSCGTRVGAKSLADIKIGQLRDFAMSFLAETPTLALRVWL